MRKWIDLVESAVTYYHGSRTQFAPGTVLRAQPDGYVTGDGMDDFERESHHKTEAIIESVRPSSAPARGTCVYLVDDPEMIDYAGGYTDHIYTVEPAHQPWRANLSWYSQLYMLCEDDADHSEEGRALAVKYWKAEPCGDDDTYEYLVSTAKVISEIE